jgi:hypothetical protein
LKAYRCGYEWAEPRIRQAGQPNGLVEFVNNLVNRHAGPPLILRFELNRGFHHFERRGIRCGLSLTRFTAAGHFWHGFD